MELAAKAPHTLSRGRQEPHKGLVQGFAPESQQPGTVTGSLGAFYQVGVESNKLSLDQGVQSGGTACCL